MGSTDDSVDLGGAADAATDDITGDLDGEESEEGGLGDIEGSEEVAPAPAMGMEPELGMDSNELGGEDMDMTAASDDDVIAIYKKLSGEDEIEIVGDEIHLNITEPGEYVVKAANSAIGGAAAATDMGTDDTAGLVPADEEGGEEGGVDYEIEMGDETEGGEEPAEDDIANLGEPAGEESGEEEEETTEEPLEEKIAVGIGMSVGNHRNPKTGGSIGAQENPKAKLDESASKKLVLETTRKYNTLLTESTKLKAENEEFRKALKVFRNQLVETVVFNSNLTYTTRLFMEHSTTKAEKQSIIKRFDNEVSNLVESKKLYKSIASELETRKPIMESVESKLIKEVSTGSSKQLNESTAYVDPSTKRILDLINRTK